MFLQPKVSVTNPKQSKLHLATFTQENLRKSVAMKLQMSHYETVPICCKTCFSLEHDLVLNLDGFIK